MKDSFEISYVTTLPVLGNAPRVTITGTENKRYLVQFYVEDENNNDQIIINEKYCDTNQTVESNTRQWYTNWCVRIVDVEAAEVVLIDHFNPYQKTIFIKIDAFALGDNIAWIPYIDFFRKTNLCTVICSTFYNDLFVKAYPDILFVKPNTVIDNVYAQYYIGANYDNNLIYSPINVNKEPLQKVASSILGLGNIMLKSNLKQQFSNKPRIINEKYVCISEYTSNEIKHWREENGWQMVVDYLNEKGYKVVVISKEPTNLKNVIDKTGNIGLKERAIDLIYADLFIGLSSGLAWLSHSLDTHVMLISDVTPNFHEFQSNITRLNKNDLKEVNYNTEDHTTISDVLLKLQELVD